MNKAKLFLENFLVYGLGGVISKIIPILMIPIVTRLMPNTAYFGISDMSNTVVSFASAFALMGVYDAMYRLFFDKEDEEYKKSVCSTAFVFTLMTSVLVFAVMVIFRDIISEIFFGSSEYANLLYITAIATLVGATNSIISAPTRMQNKRKIFLITNTISPVLAYGISMPMLLAGYYLIALPIAGATASLVMEISFWMLNKKWLGFKRFDIKVLKQLLVIGVPLLPNFLIYWALNSSNKVMITNMLDISATGIYSVGAKLGQASQLIYTAFAGGWQYFAFATMNEKNQIRSNSLIFEYLGIISYVITAFVCAFSYSIYSILFEKDYLAGYIIAPYLFLAPLLQMLFQIASNQFLIIKKTWPNLFILSFGAVVNITVNFWLIPVWGIEGAALATLLGYIISDIICLMVLCKMKLMILNKRFIFATGVFCGYFIVWRLTFPNNFMVGSAVALVITIFFAVIYRDDLKKLIRINGKEK